MTEAAAATDPLIAFYLGTGLDGAGRTLAQVLRFNHRQLEIQHDYIQWLFPLATPSEFNPGAPLLTAAAARQFREDATLRSHVLAALGVMLTFYGLELDDGDPADISIDMADHFRERAASWLTPGNHNYLRLTRMLTSLRLLGCRDDSVALHYARDCLQDLLAAEEQHRWDGSSSRHRQLHTFIAQSIFSEY
jgi:hypothetical protein